MSYIHHKTHYRNTPRPMPIEIFQTENPHRSHSAILFMFGGGWVGGTIDQFREQAQRLAKLGITAAIMEYRTKTSDEVPPFECIKDAKSCVRFLRKNAEKYSINPLRIALAGGSAGGHLATAAHSTTRWDHDDEDLSISCQANALVLFNPVIDNGPEGFGYNRVKDYHKDFSPIERIALPENQPWPPTLTMLGDNDHLIPVSTMQEFAKRIRANGGRCDERYYANAGHGFFNRARDTADYFESTLKHTVAFLRELDYIN